MNRRKILKGWVEALGLAVLVLGGCDQNPAGPRGQINSSFYFNDLSNFGRIYVYDTTTDSIRTLQFVGVQFDQMAISPDGQTLYYGNARVTGKVYIATQTAIANVWIPCHNGLAVSPDGRVLALCGDSLVVVRSSDFSVVYHSADKVINASFSADGSWLVGGLDSSVYWVHFTPRGVEHGTKTIGHHVWRVFATSYSSKWAVYLTMPDGEAAVEIWRPDSNEPDFFRYFGGGPGEIRGSGERNSVLITAAGDLLSGHIGAEAFYFLDLEGSNRVRTIKTDQVKNQDSAEVLFVPGAAAQSIDGRYVGLVNGGFEPILAIYDLSQGRVINCLDFPSNQFGPTFSTVVCGREVR